MRLERYSEMIGIVGGSMNESEVVPPFSEEEKKILEQMKKENEEYFDKTGKHLIWDVPFGMFEEDFEIKKIVKSLYSEDYVIPDDNVGKHPKN